LPFGWWRGIKKKQNSKKPAGKKKKEIIPSYIGQTENDGPIAGTFARPAVVAARSPGHGVYQFGVWDPSGPDSRTICARALPAATGPACPDRTVVAGEWNRLANARKTTPLRDEQR